MITKLGPHCKVKLLKDKRDTLVVRSPEKSILRFRKLFTTGRALACQPLVVFRPAVRDEVPHLRKRVDYSSLRSTQYQGIWREDLCPNSTGIYCRIRQFQRFGRRIVFATNTVPESPQQTTGFTARRLIPARRAFWPGCRHVEQTCEVDPLPSINRFDRHPEHP